MAGLTIWRRFGAAALFAASAMAAHAAETEIKPVSEEKIAYANGAFTPDGAHFVFALLPTDAKGSELRALEIKTGKMSSLGFAPLQQAQPATEKIFAWSMGVCGAANDLGAVYLGQYGPDLDLAAQVTWDAKAKAVSKEKPAVPKPAGAEAPGMKFEFKELDAAAAEQRKKYQKLADAPKVLGKKAVIIDGGEALDITELFLPLYKQAVDNYSGHPGTPIDENGNPLPPPEPQLLLSDSAAPLAKCGKWVFAIAKVYAHYGIHGQSFVRLFAVNAQSGKIALFAGGGSSEAHSGVRMFPQTSAWKPSPDGSAIVGISHGKIALYKVPSE